VTFGILTLATSNDYRKALGLALSVRVSNPGVPVAVACPSKLRPLLLPYFDHVIEKDPSLHGYVHKLHLDRYTPFDETFYFDSDVLVFRSLNEVLDEWRGQAYTACGNYLSDGATAFGLDRRTVLKTIGRDKLVHIDGAGHCYFRKPECKAVFDLARHIIANYQDYGLVSIGIGRSAIGDLKFADEDVIDIAMTILNLRPIPHGNFFSRYCSGKEGSVAMNAAKGKCQFVATTSGHIQQPHIMHFAAREAPFVHAMQLRQLFNSFGVSTSGLLRVAISDYYVAQIKYPLKEIAKSWLMRLGLLEFMKQLVIISHTRAFYRAENARLAVDSDADEAPSSLPSTTRTK
jgi:hypothetical protein